MAFFGHWNPAGADVALVERMALDLAHRIPEGHQIHASGVIALGSGRLGVIAPGAPVGPYASADGQVLAASSGSVLNHRALRTELERAGHPFATAADAEVIAQGYAAWELGVLDRLEGPVALAVWDAARQRLLLARDRMGQKAVYWAALGDELVFAVELKALLRHARLRRAVNPEALAYYLATGHIAPPMTILDGIKKLAPGEYLLVERDAAPRHAPYWTPQVQPASDSFEEAVSRLRAGLDTAVEAHLTADVAVGALLSGGLDSTAVAAVAARRLGQRLPTFTVRYDFEPGSSGDDKFNRDARYAAEAAALLGTPPHFVTLPRQNAVLPALLPALIAALDEPLAQHSIIQTAWLSAYARQQGVRVILGGDAADELFLSSSPYALDHLWLRRYLALPAFVRAGLLIPLLERLPARFGRARSLAARSRGIDPTRRYLDWMGVLPLDSLPGLLADPALAAAAHAIAARAISPILALAAGRPFAEQMALAVLRLGVAEDSNLILDRMGLWAGVELRAPFEDHHLVEMALNWPVGLKLHGGEGKALLKAAAADSVPASILERPKHGFMPPVSDWLRTTLRPLVEQVLVPEAVAAAGFFRPEAVTQLIDEHIAQRRYQLQPLWSLLVFHLWYMQTIDAESTSLRAFSPKELLRHT